MLEIDRAYYKISIKADAQLDSFFIYLRKHNIPITELSSTSEEISFLIQREHLKVIRKGRKNYGLKVKVRYASKHKLIPFRLPTLLGLFLFASIPILLSSFLWNITLINDTPEIADGIQEILKSEYDMKVAMPIYKLPPQYEIRQEILKQYPEISWVFLNRIGSKLTLEIQYAPQTDQPVNEPRKGHLIANASGVITHWDIQKGEKVIVKNQTVYPGDLLVTGYIQFQDKITMVGAVGEVYADYWLETNFEMPATIEFNSIELVGWEFNGIPLPEKLTSLKSWLSEFGKVQKVTKTTTHEIKVTEDNIGDTVMPILERKILLNSPKNTKIKSQKLLHLDVQDDTVKGKILFLINENIAELQPIEQGESS